MARQRLQKPIGIIARQTPSTRHPRVENGSEISTYCWTSNQNQTKQKSNFRNVTNVTITEYNSFLPVVAWALLTQLHSALDLVLANFYKRGSAVCSLQSPPSMLYRNKCIFVRNNVLFLLLSAFFCVYCYFCIFVWLCTGNRNLWKTPTCFLQYYSQFMAWGIRVFVNSDHKSKRPILATIIQL